MLISAVSVLVVAQSSSEIPEGLMNSPVYNAQQNGVLAFRAGGTEAKRVKYKLFITIATKMLILKG